MAAAAGPSKIEAPSAESRKHVLQLSFTAFAKFGDVRSNGAEITLTKLDKWLRQAELIDRCLTTNESALVFKQVAKKKRTLNMNELLLFIQQMTTRKPAFTSAEIIDSLVSCGLPSTSTCTRPITSGVIERLTDTSKFTGVHKGRFAKIVTEKRPEEEETTPHGSSTPSPTHEASRARNERRKRHVDRPPYKTLRSK